MKNLIIKAELRKVDVEQRPNLVGFADLTIGDVVLKNVAVTEKDTEKGKVVSFQTPVARKYENAQGEMIYIHTADIHSSNQETQKKLLSEIRNTLIEAMTSPESNEYGKFVAEKETDIEFDENLIKTYANPIESEKYPNLKASGTVYLGDLLKINNIRLTEHTNSETNETKALISFPSEKIEQEGETKYKEQVFPIVQGLRQKINDSIQESYLEALEKMNEQTNEQEDEEEDEER